MFLLFSTATAVFAEGKNDEWLCGINPFSTKKKMKSVLVKASFAVLVLWFISLGLLYVLPGSNQNDYKVPSQRSPETAQILQRLDSLMAEVKVLKKNNAEMRRIIGSVNPEGAATIRDKEINSNSNGNEARSLGEPLDVYEKTRRALELDMKVRHEFSFVAN